MKSGIIVGFVFGSVTFTITFGLGLVTSWLFPHFTMSWIIGSAIGSAVIPSIFGFFMGLQ